MIILDALQYFLFEHGNMMKYKIDVREITDKDLNVECPFLPEPGEYETYFSALLQEILNISVVVSAVELNGSIIVEIDSEDCYSGFRESFKAFYPPFGQKLRTTSISKYA
jgi:hypothetical protein